MRPLFAFTKLIENNDPAQIIEYFKIICPHAWFETVIFLIVRRLGTLKISEEIVALGGALNSVHTILPKEASGLRIVPLENSLSDIFLIHIFSMFYTL